MRSFWPIGIIVVICLAVFEFVSYSAGKKAADKWYAAHRPPVILLQIDASDPAICGHTLTPERPGTMGAEGVRMFILELIVDFICWIFE